MAYHAGMDANAKQRGVGRVSRLDIRRIFTLVDECRSLGDDAIAWRRHAMVRLVGLMRAQVAIGNEIADLRDLADKGWKGVPPGAPARSLAPMPIRIGFETPAKQRAWEQYAEETQTRYTPEFTTLLNADTTSVTRSRRQIWDDTSWYRSHAFTERHKAAGLDDYIISICRIPGTRRSSSIWIHRGLDDRPFGRSEWYMLDLAHRELARHIGGPLASTLQPTSATLTRRQRQTLEYLLAGMTEKQAATAMGISVPTVHEYVQAVYKHFGVHSRGELAAHFIRRYRGAMYDVPAGEDEAFINPNQER